MQIVKTYCAFIVLMAFVLMAFATTTAGAATEKPNVLFIAVDDLRPELGCYGETWMKTPNIDRLAASGVTFTRHYVQVATCGASRHALLTGLRPTTDIEYGNSAFGQQQEKLAARPTESFPHLFKQNGYHTTAIGKISHNGSDCSRDLPRSWSDVPSAGIRFPSGWDFPDPLPESKKKKILLRHPFASRDGDDNVYKDGHLADIAVTELGALKNQNRPFVLAVGFSKPHLPFSSPKKYWDMYDPEKLPAIPYPDIPEGIDPQMSLHPSFELVGQYWVPEGALEQEEYRRKLRHGYCAAVSYIDAQVGKVLDELDRLNLSKNTIVVLWGDHGWHLGDLGTWGKHTAFERALRSPLLVRTPGMKTSGQASDALIETVDIYPTLAELCGLTPPDGLGGESFAALLNNPKATGPTEAFGYHRPWTWSVRALGPHPWCKTIRTDRYRLSVWTAEKNGEKVVQVELYDHQTDPEETNNLAKTHPELVDSLIKHLDRDGITWNGTWHD